MVVVPSHINVAAPSAHGVWVEYRRSGDVRLRDRLVFTLAPLVRHAGARGPAEAQAGLEALVAAVERYEPGRHGALERFAWNAVRAALSGLR